MSTVYLSNLSSITSEESLHRFMAFCGSIQTIEMHEGNKATVTFEKPSAASTALMLNGGTLDGSPIHVSSEDVNEDTPSHAGDVHDHDDIPQEAKPRTAIVAEYLAHGYVLGDNIISKAVTYDQKNGISARFLEFFQKLADQVKTKTAELDASTGASTKAAGAYAQADEKVHLSDRAKSVWRVGKGYYSKVLSSEFGQQAQSFYTSTSNNIKSVHEEASRIAAEKKTAQSAANSPLASTHPTGGLQPTASGAPTDGASSQGNINVAAVQVPEATVPFTAPPRLA